MAQTGTLRRWQALAAVGSAGAALLAGCGGEEADGREEVTVGQGCQVAVSTDTESKPEVTVPDCDPHGELVVVDVVEGDGVEVRPGDAVTVQYAGFAWDGGEEFDASWNRGEPYEVAPVGQANVIQGWNQGLVGAQVGDRRLLVVPSELAYGDAGVDGVIAPGATLVFVVDVVAVD